MRLIAEPTQLIQRFLETRGFFHLRLGVKTCTKTAPADSSCSRLSSVRVEDTPAVFLNPSFFQALTDRQDGDGRMISGLAFDSSRFAKRNKTTTHIMLRRLSSSTSEGRHATTHMPMLSLAEAHTR